VQRSQEFGHALQPWIGQGVSERDSWFDRFEEKCADALVHREDGRE
jgi:hypothetical protein